MNLKVALQLGRVSNLPTVWTNVLAGVALAGALPGGSAAHGGRAGVGTIVGLGVAMSLFYVGGMWLNDAFDRHFDARVRPERPIPSGKVTPLEVFVGGFGMLAAGLLGLGALAFAAPSAWSLMTCGVFLAGLIVLYDMHHKDNPVSPILMGLCRVLVYLTAAAAVGPLNANVFGGAAVLLAYLIGLTYVARQENLARAENLWPLGFLAVPFLYASTSGGAWMVLITAFFFVWVLHALSFLRHAPKPRIPRAVVSLIAGISLLDAKLIAHEGHPGLAAIAVLGFALTLFFQRFIRGT
jgi:4-hydroxybenzoate polyprenyltransferase